MLCGFGDHEGRTIAYAAQTGTATRPAGYRTATRLVRLADRLGIPVLTLVDTPGAANDAEAERQGAGAAIADLFSAVAAARTPLTTLVIGEGGSGGALAPAAPGNTWATPDSYFSVIAPELAAAILNARRPPWSPRRTVSASGPRTWWSWGWCGASWDRARRAPRRPPPARSPRSHRAGASRSCSSRARRGRRTAGRAAGWGRVRGPYGWCSPVRCRCCRALCAPP